MIRAAAAATALALIAAGCHSYTRIEGSTVGDSHLRPIPGQRRALPPTVEVTSAGALRFVEPLVCANQVVVEQSTYTTVDKKPNVATLVLGLIGLSVGGVALAIGLADHDPVSAPATWLGAVGVVGGGPLFVGPLLGNGRHHEPGADTELVHGVRQVACGNRPLGERHVMVRAGSLQMVGTLDERGRLDVSPFTFVDAFALHRFPGLPIDAQLIDADGKSESVQATLSASALAAGRDGYLASIGVDGRVEKLDKVPSVTLRKIRVARVRNGDEQELEITVELDNGGPGDAWGVRAVTSSPDAQLDGRVLYVGHLPAHQRASASLKVHVGVGAIRDVDDGGLSVVALDAHDTTANVPVRFRGPVLDEE